MLTFEVAIVIIVKMLPVFSTFPAKHSQGRVGLKKKRKEEKTEFI